MRVLFVIHAPPDPGTAVYATVASRAQLLRNAGHEVEIWTPADFKAMLRTPDRWTPVLYPFLVFYRFRKLRRNFDIAIFHSYAGWVSNLLARRKLDRRPLRITEFHGLEPLYFRALRSKLSRADRPKTWRYLVVYGLLIPAIIRSSCRRSDSVFCLNEIERTFLAGRRWADPLRLQVLPNGVPEAFFFRREHPSRARKLLFVGQWLPAKGIRSLVSAFSEIARGSDVELWCVGTGASEDRVLTDFPEELRQRVRVQPRLERKEVSRVLTRAEIFVFPSLFEGFSIALLEAMASGLPIVATPVGAAPELLAGGAGILIPENKSRLLAHAIRDLLEDADKRRELGRRAREVASRYRWDRIGRVYEQALIGLLSPRPASDKASGARRTSSASQPHRPTRSR